MTKIIYKTKLLKKEDKQKVRDFIRDYDTEELTIIFSERWDELISRSNKFKWITLRTSTTGIFFSCRDSSTTNWKFGVGGVKEVKYPIIIVKINEERIKDVVNPWWNTFLHEFGHYLDYKTNGVFKKNQHGKEEYANTFTNLMEKK